MKTDSKIFSVRLGLNTCYIIRQEGTIMFDAGLPNKIRKLKKELYKKNIDPHEIKLIVISHAHFDHAGSLLDIVELTGAKVAVHELERKDLVEGTSAVPKGNSRWGSISLLLLKPFMKRIKVPGYEADIIIEDKDYKLEEFGIKGRIMHTPGHTMGSISLVMDNGDAFVGCMAHNSLPFTLRPRPPIYATYPFHLNESWKRLIAENVKTIYPGHGKAFPIEKIRPFIKG